MKNINLKNIIWCVLFLITFTSCSRFEEAKTDIYTPTPKPSNPVSDTAPLSGNIKGTMLKGKTYTISGDVYINPSDTLIIEEGVHVNVVNRNAGIIVKGTFISLGTKEQPNWITVPNVTKTDNPGADVNQDPAYKGLWKGVVAATSCPLMVIKWTHIEFAGAPLVDAGASVGLGPTKNGYDIYFQNPNGTLILEDSWLYGSVDDPIRVLGGKFECFRNTFEKCGYTGGEAVNLKAGTVGDFAYNVCIGMATNGPKASNNGATVTQTNMRFYNNTIINCGYRRLEPGRGGSINYEEGAAGMYYNNLMANCRYGPRIVPNPPADIAHLQYGYNYQYGDFVSVTNQFYPVSYIQIPQTSDFPLPSSFLPAGYKPGDTYNGTALVGQNNPLFVNAPFPLAATENPGNYSAMLNYNFRLKPNSPCIGKGYTGFVPMAIEKNILVDPKYGLSEITLPGKDSGAYQSNGTGNYH